MDTEFYRRTSDKNIYKHMVKHVPPVIGEYAYYDKRLMTDKNSYPGITLSKHYLINIVKGSKRGIFGCHFSSPENRKFSHHVTAHGLITYVNVTTST